MAYKSKKQKDAEAAIAAAAEAKAAAAETKTADERIAPVLESEAFHKEMLHYKAHFGHIPLMLQHILEEQVALRLLLEGRV